MSKWVYPYLSAKNSVFGKLSIDRNMPFAQVWRVYCIVTCTLQHKIVYHSSRRYWT